MYGALKLVYPRRFQPPFNSLLNLETAATAPCFFHAVKLRGKKVNRILSKIKMCLKVIQAYNTELLVFDGSTAIDEVY